MENLEILEIFDIIEKRSSYRGPFAQDSIPRQDLIKIIEAGVAGPTGCNTQSPYFIIIDEQEILAKVKELFPRPSIQSAPAFILVFSQKLVSIDGYYYNTQDYAAAIENMLLAITALGYASCWYEGNVREIKKDLQQLVNVPQEYELQVLLPVVKPLKPVEKRIKKIPTEQRFSFNTFTKE